MLIDRLKLAGVHFENGMTERELDLAEEFFGFRFPEELRGFLSQTVPICSDFFDYRDRSPENLKRFRDFEDRIKTGFHFDLKENRNDLLELLGQKLGFSEDGPDFDEAVMRYWQESPRLIPFYAHRCFFDGMDGMPIVSFLQPVDTIVYGFDLEEYLEAEFLGNDDPAELPPDLLKGTGIWEDLIW